MSNDFIRKCATCGKTRPVTLVDNKLMCSPCRRELRGLPPLPERGT